MTVMGRLCLKDTAMGDDGTAMVSWRFHMTATGYDETIVGCHGISMVPGTAKGL